MKFILDENFPKKAVDVLIKAGHESIDVRGTALEGCDDKTLLNFAKDKKGTLLTTDKDFYHPLHSKNKPHYGIIVIALKQPNSQAIISRLDWFLLKFSGTPLKNKCFLILDEKCLIFD